MFGHPELARRLLAMMGGALIGMSLALNANMRDLAALERDAALWRELDGAVKSAGAAGVLIVPAAPEGDVRGHSDGLAPEPELTNDRGSDGAA